MKFKTTKNSITRETTVSAYDERGNFLCNGTQGGLGARVEARLLDQVRQDAEQHQRRVTVGTASTVAESRQLAQRLS